MKWNTSSYNKCTGSSILQISTILRGKFKPEKFSTFSVMLENKKTKLWGKLLGGVYFSEFFLFVDFALLKNSS